MRTARRNVGGIGVVTIVIGILVIPSCPLNRGLTGEQLRMNLMRLKTREDYVEEFMNYANPAKDDLKLYKTCFKEEVKELLDALDEDDRENLVKEFADVQYTLSQLAIGHRVDLDEAFRRVAEANLTKVENGQIKRRDDGKILKGKNYKAPDLKGL
jgi:NTP pyrophosphatase (non-canonical NTP hydrolase)